MCICHGARYSYKFNENRGSPLGQKSYLCQICCMYICFGACVSVSPSSLCVCVCVCVCVCLSECSARPPFGGEGGVGGGGAGGERREEGESDQES